MNNAAFLNRPGQRGNVLFLILIAVALFACLSYVVTQSTRSGGTGPKEAAMLQTAAFVEQISSVKVAIDRMIIGGKRSDTFQLNNGIDIFTPCLTGPDCPFSPENGVIPPPEVPALMANMSQTARKVGYYNTTSGISVYNIGTDLADGIITAEPLNKEACETINKKLGIPPPIPSEPDSDGVLGEAFTNGEITACIDYDPTAAEYYMFYMAVIRQ